MSSQAAVVRDPQQARSIATQRRLLEATIGCIIDLGYAGTTTTKVAKRAAMSHGALFKHFPNKTLLMGAATEHLFGQLIASYREAFAGVDVDQLESVPARVEAALDLLWELFLDAPLQAALELYVAARTDVELADVLRPIIDHHAENLRGEAKRLFPEMAGSPELSSVVAGLMAALQGAAIVAPIRGGVSEEERAFIHRVALRECCDAVARFTGDAS
jgi:AcrR family transcriptional regulator